MDHPEHPGPGPLPGGPVEPDLGSDLDPNPGPGWAAFLAEAGEAGDSTAIADFADAGDFADPDDADPDDADPDDTDPDDAADAGLAWPRFAQGDQADVLPPGPLLAGLTEAVARDLDRLSDDELIGVVRATRRQIAREQYKLVLATAKFGRRRQAAFEDAARRGVPVGCRPGGFPGEELAIELVSTRVEAGHRIDDAIDLTTRLPMTLSGMADGLIDEARAGWIAFYTRSLTETDAARADEILAEAAPDLRVEQLARKAAALEMKLNPEGVAARRQHAKRTEQRVEARRELSGNASLAGRELDTADVMAAKAHIDALARTIRDSGLAEGNLDRLRALVFADLTQGRNPLTRMTAAPAGERGAPARDGGPGDGGPGDGGHSDCSAGVHPASGDGPSPFPALITLLVPADTVLGQSATPSLAGSWGLLDRDETRAAVGAAARHPRTRWCVTLTGADGTAVAHGCARGQHPRLLDDLGPQPPPARLAEILRRLNPAYIPVARGGCDHTRIEDRYTPSRALRHLVRARTAACDAPGCPALAVNADLDHTVAWPDGPTDECNLAPRCRTHHRAKQAPDWTVEQASPGVTRWTLPSGRVHVTRPTRYDLTSWTVTRMTRLGSSTLTSTGVPL